MQEHCINALKHDTPGIISCGLCFGANQHTKITDLQNRSSRRWFVDGPRWQTKCLAASWSALIACETSCAFSSSKKCCRVTEWKRSEMLYFSRNVASLLIFKISLEPHYLYNGFLHSKPTSVKTLSQDQVSPYFWVFVLHTIYRLPNAIKVISDVPVNHLWGLVSLSRKIKSHREIFNRTRENRKVRRFSASLLRRACYFFKTNSREKYRSKLSLYKQ